MESGGADSASTEAGGADSASTESGGADFASTEAGGADSASTKVSDADFASTEAGDGKLRVHGGWKPHNYASSCRASSPPPRQISPHHRQTPQPCAR
ncbi:hypothetical protein FHG87_020615 [Trinorchestia longiramus]|nr:hypothetical protein FHG87_020615 [Trinorchestia longiramus]